jgi:HD-GYP domain-containing protein (c-di-GMP phosphodiesterase class II)
MRWFSWGEGMHRLLRNNRLLGSLFAAAGVGVLASLLVVQSLPPLGPFLFFAALAAYADWRSVQFGWSFRASGTVMAVLASGVAFVSTGSSLAMALVAMLGAVGPIDVRERRIFYPVANFGQLVISAAAGGLALDLVLRGAPSSPGRLLFAAGFAGVVQVTINAVLVLLINRAAGVRLRRADLKGLLLLLPPYLVMSVLGGLLGATYLSVGTEALPLIGVMILMSNWAAVSYGGLMEARESTIRGFSKALEARDIFSRGHAERTMDFAEMIAEEFGFNPEHVERLRLAALLSDVSSLAVPRDLLDHEHALTDEEASQIAAYMSTIDEMLAQVDFLEPAVDIARGRLHGGVSPRPRGRALDAQVMAVAKRFDQLTTGTGRTEAVTQDEALTVLRGEHRRSFDSEVIDALEAAIARRGLRYGRVILAHVPTAEDIAMKRMYERQ